MSFTGGAALRMFSAPPLKPQIVPPHLFPPSQTLLHIALPQPPRSFASPETHDDWRGFLDSEDVGVRQYGASNAYPSMPIHTHTHTQDETQTQDRRKRVANLFPAFKQWAYHLVCNLYVGSLIKHQLKPFVFAFPREINERRVSTLFTTGWSNISGGHSSSDKYSTQAHIGTPPPCSRGFNVEADSHESLAALPPQRLDW